jgi:chemotaxis protein methyltransferase CheR
MSDILKLRDLIYAETGMYFPNEKQYYFENRFLRRMEALGISNFTDYHQFLKNENGSREELNRLISEMTINETSFFRNMPQFTALQNLVIPELAKTREGSVLKRLKIWSAGCSSGEEVYTIAMILNEMGAGLLKGWYLEVQGTDIDSVVLQKAQEGIYREYSTKNMPDEFKNKYFQETSDGHVIDQAVKKMVRFKKLNLNDDMSMIFMKGYDVIFCRNVLIYFDIESKKRVIQHFFNNLAMGGYLFIGFSESLFQISDRFKLIHYPGGMVYQKVAHI